MAEETKAPVIVIIKKKVTHAAHHGGAWKVAYADFVTAMMALFIVLWLLNTSDKVKQAISAYFRDPSGLSKEIGSGVSGANGETIKVNSDNMGLLKDKLEQAMKTTPEFEKLKDYVQFGVTGDGLRVEMMESEKGMFFESGGASPSKIGADLIRRMAAELGRLPNEILIEGHTDARPFGSKKDYTNWELSTDRANAARRLMEENGLREGQVAQVRGFGARQLRVHDDPNAASNRRISVIVKYQSPPAGGRSELPGAGKAEAKPVDTKSGETRK